MTKLAALFGVPTALVGALVMTGVISDTVAGAAGFVLGSVQVAVAAYLDPSIPWVGRYRER